MEFEDKCQHGDIVVNGKNLERTYSLRLSVRLYPVYKHHIMFHLTHNTEVQIKTVNNSPVQSSDESPVG